MDAVYQPTNAAMRHVIQISGPADNCAALCDDGTVWQYDAATRTWVRLPTVPGHVANDDAAEARVAHDRMVIEQQESAQQVRRERFQGLP